MRNKRKIFTAFLICLLLSCTMRIHIVSAATPPVLSASADTADAVQGNTIQIQIQLNHNPDLSTLGMTLNYNNSMLRYLDSAWSNHFFGSDMTMASDTGDAINLSFVCESSYPSDGTLVTVRFEALENLSSIPVTLALRDMADANLSPVSDCQVIQEIQVPETMDLPEVMPETESEPETVDAAKDAPAKESEPETLEKESAIQPAVYATEPEPKQNQPVSTQNAKTAKADENYKTGAGIGNDVIVLAAAICGIICLLLLAIKERRKEHI